MGINYQTQTRDYISTQHTTPHRTYNLVSRPRANFVSLPHTGRSASLCTPLKRLQISKAGDHPAERDERLACRRVCDGEQGPRGARGSSSILAVKILISSPPEDTRATEGGGMTSATFSASWATLSRATCARVAIMA
jgi:hypothetical protein